MTAQSPAYVYLFHIFMQVFGHLLGELSLANARRSKEEKDERVLVVNPAVLLAPDS